jgi:hypothetical protein
MAAFTPETQTARQLWEHAQHFPKYPERVDQLELFREKYSEWLAELLILAERAGRAIDRFSELACKACDQGEVPHTLCTLIALEATRV